MTGDVGTKKKLTFVFIAENDIVGRNYGPRPIRVSVKLTGEVSTLVLHSDYLHQLSQESSEQQNRYRR